MVFVFFVRFNIRLDDLTKINKTIHLFSFRSVAIAQNTVINVFDVKSNRKKIIVVIMNCIHIEM